MGTYCSAGRAPSSCTSWESPASGSSWTSRWASGPPGTGGFGSYEAQRSRIGLEWLNPAEMFGDSMTEHSFVECTASCLAALAACRENFAPAANGEMTRAIARAEEWLRRTQASDGSWRGVWGIQFIYGTLFGVRGLVAAGARPGDPALRLACRWLLDRQRADGGWGEHHSGCQNDQPPVRSNSRYCRMLDAYVSSMAHHSLRRNEVDVTGTSPAPSGRNRVGQTVARVRCRGGVGRSIPRSGM